MNEGPAPVSSQLSGDGGPKRQLHDSAVTEAASDAGGGPTEETSTIQPGPSENLQEVTTDLDLSGRKELLYKGKKQLRCCVEGRFHRHSGEKVLHPIGQPGAHS